MMVVGIVAFVAIILLYAISCEGHIQWNLWLLTVFIVLCGVAVWSLHDVVSTGRY